MTYLINIEEPEEGLKRTERIKAPCMEDAQLLLRAQFPSWHIINIEENNTFYNKSNMLDDNGYSKADDHNPYPEE